MPRSFDIDPDDLKDYNWAFKDWLPSGDTISSFTLTADDGITVDSSSVNAAAKTIDGVSHPANTVVTAWVSVAQAGVNYNITCQITTAAGRKCSKTLTWAGREE